MQSSAVQSLAESSFTDGIETQEIGELRSRRTQCQNVEESLSFRRRIVQGRLDIVHADLCVREGDESEGRAHESYRSLIEDLPGILKESGGRATGGRLTTLSKSADELDADFDKFVEELDRIVDARTLKKLGDLDTETVKAISEKLDKIERELSETRHGLHRNIDRIQAEIVKRYRTGEASIDSLLNPGG